MSALEIARFIVDSMSAAGHLTAIEQWFASAELALGITALQAARALSRRHEPATAIDYDKAA